MTLSSGRLRFGRGRRGHSGRANRPDEPRYGTESDEAMLPRSLLGKKRKND